MHDKVEQIQILLILVFKLPISNSGADLGFWERGGPIKIFTTGGGYGRGRAPSRDSKHGCFESWTISLIIRALRYMIYK